MSELQNKYWSGGLIHHHIQTRCYKYYMSVQEPSLFAVAKLLETGLVNLPRVEVLWRPLTNHLLEVCQHPHIRMREWGVEAITYLVKAALQHKYQPPLKDNQVCVYYNIFYIENVIWCIVGFILIMLLCLNNF